MSVAPYRQQWEALRLLSPDPQALGALASQAAAGYMDGYYAGGRGDPALIRLLCEMATFSADPACNRPASRALFRTIIEGLCDDFEEMHEETYRQVMSDIIGQVRNTPAGAHLDRALGQFGLADAAALAARHRRLCGAPAPLPADFVPAGILLLSRVTVGADVAITTVLVQRLERRFPDVPVVLLGDRRLGELFGSRPGLRVHALAYPRHGGVLERFDAWLDALDAVEAEARAAPGPWLVVDPDSRITQLGMLPMTRAGRTLFFNSRAGRRQGEDEQPMGVLANRWADVVFGPAPVALPELWLAPALVCAAQAWTAAAHAAGSRSLVAVSFGTGENARKRISTDFECRLLRELLARPDTLVLLDLGWGQEEAARNRALVRALAEAGVPCRTALFPAPPPGLTPGLLAVDTGIGGLAALVGRADEFIGYDSAGQHMAAALGVPGVTVFCGSNNSRFIRRWQAWGRAAGALIHVDTLSHGSERIDVELVLGRIRDRRAAAGAAEAPARTSQAG